MWITVDKTLGGAAAAYGNQQIWASNPNTNVNVMYYNSNMQILRQINEMYLSISNN